MARDRPWPKEPSGFKRRRDFKPAPFTLLAGRATGETKAECYFKAAEFHLPKAQLHAEMAILSGMEPVSGTSTSGGLGDSLPCAAPAANDAAKGRSWRQWFQFSIRSLLILTALIAVALCWFVSRFERERRAVAAIEALGVKVRYRDPDRVFGSMEEWLRQRLPRSYFDPVIDVGWPQDESGFPFLVSDPQFTDSVLAHVAGLKSLEHLHAAGSKVTDAGLIHLAGLTSLRRIDLSRTDVTDNGVAHFARLTLLRRIDLDSTLITDKSVAHLAALTSLEHLGLRNNSGVKDPGLAHLERLKALKVIDLTNTQVTDAGLAHVAGLGSLERLYLSQTQVTDVGFAHLVGLASLDHLDLARTQVTDAGLIYLSGPKRLEFLDLSYTHVADAGLAHLAGLRSLKYISLHETSLTDEGLLHLGRLKSLEYVTLTREQFTDPGIEQLKMVLPNCHFSLLNVGYVGPF